MISLIKIRSMLEQMSVIERKLAEFILDNAHLLRDYSSQQLADAVGISQSSVVKFCQKLGYKGYPDLKLAVNEAVITATTLNRDTNETTTEENSLLSLVEQLQFSLQSHLRSIMSVNHEKNLLDAAQSLHQADKVLLAGYGKSGIVAADMQFRLLQQGKLAISHTDPIVLQQFTRTLTRNSVILLISESGQNTRLLELAALAAEQKVKIISLTSYKTNALAIAADINLFALSGDENRRINPILVQMAQQHLCHILYLLLCQRQHNEYPAEPSPAKPQLQIQ
ncbi:MurR/RpiR family transcriptional regulator [Chromatiaceae bacterium AAb-1]|nr:MurR/RpiR family transcriptional regulator [Chromatiaceae bacterium AAb-1]